MPLRHARKLGADAAMRWPSTAARPKSKSATARSKSWNRRKPATSASRSMRANPRRSISGSVLTREAIHRLAETALAMARLAPPDPFRRDCRPEQLATEIPRPRSGRPTTCRMPPGSNAWRAQAEAAALAVQGVSKSGGAGASASDRIVAIVMSNGFAQGYRRTGMRRQRVGDRRRRHGDAARL